MNSKHERISILFLAIIFTICIFIVVDSAYEDPFWEFNTYALKIRLQSLILCLISFYLAGFGYQHLATYFIGKSKDKKIATWKEYLFVFLINFVFLNILYLVTIYFITKMGFRWKELMINYVTLSVLLLLFYMLVRNRFLFKSYVDQNLQLEKIKVDQLETELKFLKSQYHPHFLFNALNTIYFQIDENNKEAKQSIEQLSDLLRYQLYDIEQEVTMEQEINYLQSYIAFQQLRMSERLVLDVYFDPELKEQKIHPLLFQPLVENAFKYVRGEYKIRLDLKLVANQIEFEIQNSISSKPQQANNKKDNGIGIENLERRLNLLYPDKYNMEIKQTDFQFVVKLSINTD